MVDPDDQLQATLEKASEVYSWFTMLQVVGFDKAEAFVPLPPLIVGGHILRRD